jgi:hypothetical protein
MQALFNSFSQYVLNMEKFWSALVGNSVLSARVVLFESDAAIQILARHELYVFRCSLKNKMNKLNVFVI